VNMRRRHFVPFLPLRTKRRSSALFSTCSSSRSDEYIIVSGNRSMKLARMSAAENGGDAPHAKEVNSDKTTAVRSHTLE
jgi:hypothetical protein